MRWVIYGMALLLFLPMLLLAPVLGMLVNPWAPWWFSGQTGIIGGDTDTAVDAGIGMLPPVDPDVLGDPGHVSDAGRYRFARGAGFAGDDAIIATAISMAEDGSGDPKALSGRNNNGTYDLGLWQINSSHWAQFGGRAALENPDTNARAAFSLRGSQGWCAWSTFGPGCPYHGCGPPCYSDFLGRAKAASQIQSPPGEA